MPERSIHFIGIGGIGMSALARYFNNQKVAVCGSDTSESSITRSLRKESIKLRIGHKKGNVDSATSLVIVSQAIRPDNPELIEARRRGIRVLTYPQAVGEITEQYKTIAIAGAHGKSTTTALIGLMLIKSGLDPTIIVGTNLKELGGKNFRQGKGKYFVLEADEYGRAFLNYSPTITVVTNIDREHLDIYKNLADVKKTFLKLFENTANGGSLILNRDDKNLYSLKKQIDFIAKKKHLNVAWYSLRDSGVKEIKRKINIFGEHNLSNAAGVYKLGRLLRLSEKQIITAVGSYRGAWRRMEYRGESKIENRTLQVFDDYAHHPTEIKATLSAFKEKFPRSPVICVFQPHQTQRLRLLFDDFKSSFQDAEVLVLIPSYHVAGREKLSKKFTSKTLAVGVKKKYPHKKVYYLEEPAKLKVLIKRILNGDISLKPGHSQSPVLIMMGAGNIADHTDGLLR